MKLGTTELEHAHGIRALSLISFLCTDARMCPLPCHLENGSMTWSLISVSLQTVESCNVHITMVTNHHMRSPSVVVQYGVKTLKSYGIAFDTCGIS